MATLESLRQQIDTATDLNSVVKTMKTMAAVSIRQYEQAVDALQDYNRTIEMGFQIVLGAGPLRLDPPGQRGRTGAVVFGSDQGMCGQFNEEIVTFVRRQQRSDRSGEDWMLLVIGARAEEQLLEAEVPVDRLYHVPTALSDVTNLVLELLPRIELWREKSHLTHLLVFYNHRTLAASFEAQILQLLPIEGRLLRDWSRQGWRSRSLPTFATDRSQLLSRLIRQYLFATLFRACVESLASENASRISAMQAAEKNIEERLDELQGSFNQLRQELITEELLDVVTGFEALDRPD